MELQDFAPQSLFSRLVYNGTEGSVMDRRGAIAKGMSEHLKLPSVRLLSTAAEVVSDDDREQYRIGIAQIYASLTTDDFADATTRARSYFDMALKHVPEVAIASVATRTAHIAAADSFAALRDALATKLASGLSGLGREISLPLDDLGWQAEFRDDKTFVGIRVGPMNVAQLQTLLHGADPEDYPPHGAFLEVFREESATRTLTDSEALSWWDEAIQHHRGQADRIGAWLAEMVRQ